MTDTHAATLAPTSVRRQNAMRAGWSDAKAGFAHNALAISQRFAHPLEVEDYYWGYNMWFNMHTGD